MSVSVKVCLVALALAALAPATGGQVCRWGPGSGQGLAISSLDEGASRLAMLLNVTTMEECQERCCRDANCHLAMIGLPADGAPQCLLFSCLVQGRDVCLLQPNHQFTASRKVALTAEERVERIDTSTERCRRPRRVGPCRAAFPRVYYDVVNQTCTPFIYGGCQANDNHFYTLEECEEACSGVTGSVLSDESSPAPPTASPAPQAAARRMAPAQPDGSPLATREEDEDRSVVTEINTSENDLAELSVDDFAARCEATPETGPCRASLRHWYYDRHTRSCQPFVYGGCHGNKNNYVSQESCMSACTVTVVPRGPARDDQTPMHYAEHCLGEADPGLCRAAFPMFFYHAASGTCRHFIYGGCGGNLNRFTTEEECMGSCAAGPDGQLGHAKRRDRWAPAFFLVGTLAVISALLLAALILITLRRVRLPHRASSHSDKEELLPELDEHSSLESLSVPESPKSSKA